MNAEEITAERGKTHGSFAVNSIIAQRIREAMRDPLSAWHDLPVRCREALDHIAGKIGRICSTPDSNHMEPDHWLDIEGYAYLAREGIEETNAVAADSEWTPPPMSEAEEIEEDTRRRLHARMRAAVAEFLAARTALEQFGIDESEAGAAEDPAEQFAFAANAKLTALQEAQARGVQLNPPADGDRMIIEARGGQ